MRNHHEKLIVYATEQTRSFLNWMDDLLDRFCGIEWRLIEREISLGGGLSAEAIPLNQSIAFAFRDNAGKTTVIAPAVAELTGQLRAAIDLCDLVFFDGTFCSEDELRKLQPNSRTASGMNHWAINSGSLDFLRKSTARRKIYIHVNNTNPILMPGSAERKMVEQAGIEIAGDGMEITL